MRNLLQIRRRRSGPHPLATRPIIALEKRIAFDGAGAATLAQAAQVEHHVEHTGHPGQAAGALPGDHAPDGSALADLAAPRDAARLLGGGRLAEASAPQAKSVVFIESDVPDVATLIRNIDRSADVVLLDAGKDGVDAIASYLSRHRGVADVYIFSHGSQGRLDLGTAVLDGATMRGRYAADLATIRDSLGAEASILVYGCDFALGPAGDGAARLLSALTGAAVAASTNPTGGAAEGGDFVLEERIGEVADADVLDPHLADNYHGLLLNQQNTGAFTITTGTSGAPTSGQTVATALTADGAVRVVVTVTPDASNSVNSLTTTTGGAAFDTTAPAGSYGAAGLNGQPALEETLQYGGTPGGSDGGNSATVTVSYYDANTGAPVSVTDAVINIDRIGGSATNASRQSVANSSDLTVLTPGATLTRLSGSSGAFTVSASDISETVNTVLASGFGVDSNADPTLGTAAGTVRVNGTFSTLTFHWAKAAGALNGGDRIDLIFSADTTVTANGANTTQTLADGQHNVAVATSQGFDDPSGLPTTYALSGTLPAGLSFDPATGLISGDLDHDASKDAPTTSGTGATLEGSYAVTVTATNSTGSSATQTFTLDAVNAAPAVAMPTPDQASSDGQTIGAVDASSAFADPNGDPLTFTASGLPAGLSISSAGLITGTVAGNAAPGAYAVTVTATDDKGASTDESFTWTVSDVPPTAVGTLPDRSTLDGQSGVAISTAQGFAASNGNPLSYAAAGLPAGLTIDAASGVITGTVDHDASKDAPTSTGAGATLDGTYAVTVTAADGLGGTATQRFAIDARNSAPALGKPTPDQASDAGAAVTPVNAASAFSDPNGDPLRFSASGLPAGLTIDSATGLISGTVAGTAAPGGYSVTVTATDDKEAATEETFTWTVRDVPPTAVGTLPDRSTLDGQSGVAIATAQGFSDANGVPLAFSAAGLPAGLAIDPSTGLISGTVDHDASANAPARTGAGATLDGFYAVVVTADDRQGGTASQRFTLDARNGAPVAGTPTADQSDRDGDTITPVDASRAFSDPNGDPLRFAASGLPAGLAIDPATGLITGRVAADAPPGTTAVLVTATDDKGATARESFNWTIADVPPAAAGTLPDRTGADGAPVSIATADGFTSPNGLPLGYAADGLPPGLSIDPATGVISGRLDHDASAQAPATTGEGATLAGSYAVTVTASDGQGGSAVQRFTLEATNGAPAVVAPTPDQHGADGGRLSLDGGSAFADPNAGDTLAFTAAGLPPGLGIDPATGRISGTLDPRASAAGPATVTLTATDDKGAATRETFTFVVDDVPPTAASALPDRSDADGTPVSFATAGAFANPNGLPLVYGAAGLPAGLRIDPATGVVSGTLDHDASAAASGGLYAVTVTASDGQGGSAATGFHLAASNQAPAAVAPIPDQGNRNGDPVSPLDVAGAFADPNPGDVLTFAASGLPAGLAIDPATGRISGTIAGDAAPGTADVTVTATDDKGAAGTQRFAWEVSDTPPAAVGTLPNRIYADGQGGIAIATASGFADANGNPLAFTATGLPPGLAIDPTTGAITGTLDRNASAQAPVRSGAPLDGTFAVTVTASDHLGGEAVQRFTIDAVHRPLTLREQTPDQRSAAGTTIAPLDVAAAFGDLTGDRLTYAATGLPPGLTIDPGTGRIGGTIDPSRAASTVTRVLVVASDDSGGTLAESFLWRVDAAPSSVLPAPAAPLPGPDAPAADRAGPSAEAATPVLDAVDLTSGAEERSQVISAEGIVVSTVNGIAPLNGLQRLTEPGTGIVRAGAGATEEGDRFERARTGLGRGVAELSTPLDFLGASALDDAAGPDGTAINVETLLRDRVLTIAIDNAIRDQPRGGPAAPVAFFDVTGADGRPLPSWLRGELNGVLVGKVPAGVERLAVTVRSTLPSGIVTERTMTILTDRGTIIPHRAGRPPMTRAGRR